jgi:MFS family permease
MIPSPGLKQFERPPRGVILLFSAVVFCFWFAQYAYAPTLPDYIYGHTGSLRLVGLVLSMYGIWQALVRLPLGILIDARGGQKTVIITGLVLGGLGALLLWLSGGTGWLAAGRALSGLAAGIWVPLVVAFSAYFTTEETVYSIALITAVSAGGRILSTALTGVLTAWGGSGLPFLVAILASGLAVLLLVFLPLRTQPRRKPSLSSLLALAGRREVLIPSLLGIVNQYVLHAVALGFLPLLAKQQGASDNRLSLLATTYQLSFVAGNLLSGRLGRRFPGAMVLAASYLVIAGATVAGACGSGLALFLAVQIGIGLGHGVGYPIQMGLTIQRTEGPQRFTAMGIYQSTYSLGIFAGPWLSGQLAAAVGIQPMFAFTALAALTFGLLGSWRILRSLGRTARL